MTFDLLVEFHLERAQDIGRFVTERILMMLGVKDTYTVATFKASCGTVHSQA